MNQRNTTLVKFQLFSIILISFVFLFGFAGTILAAATCASFDGAFNWQKSDITCTLKYEDTGGSGLKACTYEIKSSGVRIRTGSFSSAQGCTGSGPFEPEITISVQDLTGNCRNNGLNKCTIDVTAKDNSDNTDTSTHRYDIDYSPPVGGSIFYSNGFTNSTSVDLAVNDGTDAHSNIDISTRIVQRKLATLSNSICGTYGSFVNISVENPYPLFKDSSLVSGKCYQYQYLVQDNAGNQATYTSSNVVKVAMDTIVIFVDSDKHGLPWKTSNISIIITPNANSGTSIVETRYRWNTNFNNISCSNGDGGTPGTSTSLSNEGTHILYMCTRNEVGRTGTRERTYYLDKTEPDITQFNPNSTSFNIANATLIITYAVSDPTPGSGLKSVELWRKKLSDSGWGTVAYITQTISGTSKTGTFTDSFSLGVEETYNYGIHVIDQANLRCKDSHNPCASDVSTLTIQVDTKAPPAPSVCNYPCNTTVTGNHPTLSWSIVTDLSTPITYRLQLDDENSFSSPFLVDQSLIVQGTEKSSFALGNTANILDDGSSVTTGLFLPTQENYYWRVKSKDGAGNESGWSPSWNFKVNMAPSANAGPDKQVFETLTVALQGSGSDPDGSISSSGWSCTGGSVSGFTYTAPSVTSDTTYTCIFWVVDNDGASDSDNMNVVVKNDDIAPTVDLFKVNNKTYPNPPTVNVNSSFSVEWTISDTGGSGFKNAEVWRAWDANGDGNLQSSEWNDSSPASGTQPNPISTSTNSSNSMDDNPSNGTYWYGLHGIDSVNNCIDETGSHACGGVSSDSLDTRTVRGPIKVRMQHNSAPTIQGSPSDTPDPIKANVDITFSVDWNDPGDEIKLHICKNVLSGISCDAQGSWYVSSSFSANDPATGTYTISVLDEGDNVYNAYVCDDENACSSAKAGSFFVDIDVPIVSSFGATPAPPLWVSNGSPNVTISWSVLDIGGANLKQIEVWRAWDANDDGVLQDSEWSDSSPTSGIQSNPISTKTSGFDTNSTDSDSYTDTPGTGVYWYGLHVLDNADNMGTESTSQKVQVDKEQPVSAIQSPNAGSFRGSDFSVNVADVDTGGSLLNTGECKYSVDSFDGDSWQNTKVDATRTCSANTPNITTVDDCPNEGVNTCRVIVKSKDIAGNSNVVSEPQNSIRNFSIDLTWPVVDKVSCSADLDTECDRVQSGVNTTFRARVSDNIQLSDCRFLWRTLPSGSWQEMTTPSFIPDITCENGHVGDCLEAFTEHIFSPGGSYDVRAQCWDSAFHTMPGDFSTITAETLSVTLNADPTYGSINTLFDLSSQVAGTATGNANFKFDCRNDGWDYERDNIDLSASDPGWIIRSGDGSTETRVIAPDTFAVRDLCQYDPPNTYTANTQVEQGVSIATDTVDIEISANNLPVAIPQTPIVDSYCVITYPHITLPWQFSDLDPGDTQTAYQVQIATKQNFQEGSIIDNTDRQEGANSEYSPASGILDFDDTYYWRIKVWDEFDESAWATGTAFTTPDHAYPNPKIPYNFTFSPQFPSAEEQIGFIDHTNFATASKFWSWDFDSSNGIQQDSTDQNPTHTYLENGIYEVTLTATDDVGSCQNKQDVNVTLPFPEWQEISPF